jgi:hypothetical protein
MACLYCGSEAERCISSDEAARCHQPSSGFIVHRNAGHPWDRRSGWDLMEVKASTEAALTRFIARAAEKFGLSGSRTTQGQRRLSSTSRPTPPAPGQTSLTQPDR